MNLLKELKLKLTELMDEPVTTEGTPIFFYHWNVELNGWVKCPAIIAAVHDDGIDALVFLDDGCGLVKHVRNVDFKKVNLDYWSFTDSESQFAPKVYEMDES